MTDRIEVGDVEEFEPGDRQIIEVRGVEVGVFNVDGEFHAILNTCPHQNGPVAEGTLGRRVVADLPNEGQRVEERYDPDMTVIRCPCHSWGFDIATGDHIGGPDIGYELVTYDAVVEGGTVYLEL